MKAWDKLWPRGHSCDKSPAQTVLPRIDTQWQCHPAPPDQSTPLSASSGSFHPSGVSVLSRPGSVLNQQWAYCWLYLQRYSCRGAARGRMQRPFAPSVCFRGLGTAGQDKGFWRYWALSFKEGLKKIGVIVGEKEKNRREKGSVSESPGLWLFPSAPGGGAKPLLIPQTGDKFHSSRDYSPTCTTQEKY